MAVLKRKTLARLPLKHEDLPFENGAISAVASVAVVGVAMGPHWALAQVVQKLSLAWRLAEHWGDW